MSLKLNGGGFCGLWAMTAVCVVPTAAPACLSGRFGGTRLLSVAHCYKAVDGGDQRWGWY
jgi:hypothetical protein